MTAPGECQTTNVAQDDKKDDDDLPPPLDEGDIALLKAYGIGPYTKSIKKTTTDIEVHMKTIATLIGIKESDTGLCQPSQWDLVGDEQMMKEEEPLQVARVTKISEFRIY
jgi:26S proteasome regulatory subunit T1